MKRIIKTLLVDSLQEGMGLKDTYPPGPTIFITKMKDNNGHVHKQGYGANLWPLDACCGRFGGCL